MFDRTTGSMEEQCLGVCSRLWDGKELHVATVSRALEATKHLKVRWTIAERSRKASFDPRVTHLGDLVVGLADSP